jgi:hypothetical protein
MENNPGEEQTQKLIRYFGHHRSFSSSSNNPESLTKNFLNKRIKSYESWSENDMEI